MKGISFQNGIEYKVAIDGETWSQGDFITGTLEAILRNPSAAHPSIKTILAEGSERKIKNKSADAFLTIESAQSTSSPLKWKFQLPLDIRVSDKAGSLYLLYGSGEENAVPGQLKLNIIPHLHLRDFFEILLSHFRFVPKGISAGKKGWTETKFDSPAAREWASLEKLNLLLKIDAHQISTTFQFYKNVVDVTKPGLASQIAVIEISREWELKKIIHDFNQRLNKEVAIAETEQVIEEYREKSPKY